MQDQITYKEFLNLAKKNPTVVYYWSNGGNGKAQSRGYYCPKRDRIITECTNDGIIWF